MSGLFGNHFNILTLMDVNGTADSFDFLFKAKKFSAVNNVLKYPVARCFVWFHMQ